MGRRLRAVLTLYRWDSSFALAVLFLAASPQPARAASLAGAFAWFFAAAGAYALNDAMDVEIDRVNHAERPVPAGELSTGAAKVAAALAFVAALLAATLDTGLLMWILPCPAVALLFCIVVRKRSSLASNVLASAGVACIPLSAAPLRGSPGVFVVPSLAFVVMLARELQMDLRDSPGDRVVRPSAVMLGMTRRRASGVYRAILALSLVVLVLLVRSRHLPAGAWAFLVIGAIPLAALMLRDPFAASDLHAQLLKLAGCGVIGVLVSSS
jgi:4-hydroxybenzoate polyprenyltransferase